MSNNDLQALFSSLRTKSNSSATLSRSQSQEASTNFPSASQIPLTPPPPFSPFNPASSNAAMDASRNPPAAQNLLNLLNFGSQHGPIVPEETSSAAPDTHESKRPKDSQLSASDLVARLTSPQATGVYPTKNQNAHAGVDGHNSGDWERPLQPSNPLLELLSRQKPGNKKIEPENPHTKEIINEPSNVTGDVSGNSMKGFEPVSSREPTPLETMDSAREAGVQQKPMFTYTNPFEALKASRPLTPKNQPVTPLASKKLDVKDEVTGSKSGGDIPENTESSVDLRKELTPRSQSNRNTIPEQSLQQEETLFSNSPVPDSGPDTSNNQTDTPQYDNRQIQKSAEDFGEVVPQASPEWEDLPASPVLAPSARIVPVYTFPIKAFLSITLKFSHPADVGMREEGIMEISRIKKDFDQVDRSLAAATSKYICYALVKHGGMRIIRQDDGKDRHVFKHSNDRIFNVSVCTGVANTPSSDDHAILGTGISGAVYYATLCSDGIDLVEQNNLETASLIFPAFPQSDENTAGGVLKTRAKRSSRHPEFFAIGRGKVINVIWPSTAMSARYGISENERQVDVEKFFRERTLQISTGKAGKDFVFSEDDTMIVSLDKTGRLRFWDVRKLVEEENATSGRMNPVTVDTPLLSLMTASPAEKSWPTSVLFVDKARPYNKGGPLRYVLVGLRQNHTLQLWDIALGKAVQEINFPHESEVDGICSVNYHPGSGIIVVSHPTRNSIFFVHLSAPRYTLSSSLTQASYVQRVAARDPDIPKPDSTACMSGIRELSFTGRGILRSVELLSVQKPSEKPRDADANQTLFELYVVHSKGVTCLAINKEDLGWNAESKVVQPIDAEKENLVSLHELKLGSVIEENPVDKSPSKEEAQVSQTTKNTKKKPKKSKDSLDEPANGVNDTGVNAEDQQRSAETEILRPEANAEVSVIKEQKRNKKKQSQTTIQPNSQTEHTRDISPQKQALHPSKSPVTVPANQAAAETRSDTVSMSISGDWLDKELKKLERIITSDFRKEFDVLFKNIQQDRASQEQSSAARQETVLRLVSSSLNTNVEKSLSRILAAQMHEIVIPSVVQSVSAQISDGLARHLSVSLPAELRSLVPAAISTTMRELQLSRTISDAVVTRIDSQLRPLVTNAIRENLDSTMTAIATEAAEKATSLMERKFANSVRQLQVQHDADRQQINDLSKTLDNMANTLKIISNTQASLHKDILRTPVSSETAKSPEPRNKSAEKKTLNRAPTQAEIELDEVRTLMYQRKFEEGSIKWLQSSQPVQLFDMLFVNFTPEYLSSDVSPLVAFSIAVTVAGALQTNTDRRLEWISTAFDAIDFNDREVIELSQHAPQLVSSMIQKLESLYMSRAEINDKDHILQAILPVVKKARELRNKFQELNERRAR